MIDNHPRVGNIEKGSLGRMCMGQRGWRTPLKPSMSAHKLTETEAACKGLAQVCTKQEPRVERSRSTPPPTPAQRLLALDNHLQMKVSFPPREPHEDTAADRQDGMNPRASLEAHCPIVLQISFLKAFLRLLFLYIIHFFLITLQILCTYIIAFSSVFLWDS